MTDWESIINFCLGFLVGYAISLAILVYANRPPAPEEKLP